MNFNKLFVNHCKKNNLDINPDQLPQNTIDNISSFVSDGGGSLVIMAGKRFTPSSDKQVPSGTYST